MASVLSQPPAGTTVAAAGDITGVLAAFSSASRQTVATLERTLEAARRGNDEIASMNRRINSRLEGMDAQHDAW